MAMVVASLLTTSCIYDDLADCGIQYHINYHMNLKTNIDVEISEQLTTQPEQEFANLLRSSLSNIFTDYALDNDLSFYQGGDLVRHEANEMHSNTASYTIYLQRGEYQHLALANMREETQVSIVGQDNLQEMALRQMEGDTIDSHHFGLFSARLPIKDSDFDQDLNTQLYMQNCAAAVVIDRGNLTPEYVMGFTEGMATRFAVADSTYYFDSNTAIRAKKVSNDRYDGLYTVNFPSRMTAETKVDDALWKMHVIIKMNGRYTENILSVREPLKAGNLKIIKVKLNDDGSVTTHAGTSVGVSVRLDWKPGGNHEVDI